MDFNIDGLPDEFLEFAWDSLNTKSRQKLLQDKPKTVWVFGAGASHHYELNAFNVQVPLAKGFFNALHDLPSSKGFHSHIGPLVSYLYHYRGVHPSKTCEFDENIEDFMTSIENELLELKNKKLKNNQLSKSEFEKLIGLSQVYNNMIFLFTNVINESQNGPVSPVFSELLKFCGPNDRFISFNWDTLIDKALAATGNWSPMNGYKIDFTAIFDGSWKQKIDYSSVFADDWKLLKLHGSTNWLVPYTGIHLQTADYQSIIPEGDKVFLYWQSSLPYETYSGRWRGGYEHTCYGYYPPNIPTDYFSTDSINAKPGYMIASVKFHIFSPFEEQNGNGIPSSPLIITPVRQKRYELYIDTIEKLWKHAEDELMSAHKIVVIDYSFPHTDKRTLNLIKDVFDKRKGEIELVLIDPWIKNTVAKFESHLGHNAKSLDALSLKFEDYVLKLWNNAPKLMKQAIYSYQEVKDWIMRIYMLSTGFPFKELDY